MQTFLSFLAHHMMLVVALSVVGCLLLALELFRAKTHQCALSVQAAILKMNHAHAVVIDIRPEAAFKQGHILHAVSILSTTLKHDFDTTMQKFKNKPKILVCQTGEETRLLASKHAQPELYYLAGGMRAWIEASMPTTTKS